MNADQAKEILLLHRPGMSDPDVPEVAEALALAERDPAVREWFAAHCALQARIATGFQAVAAPDGLRQQIVSENPARARPRLRKSVLLSVLAVAAVLILAGPKLILKWGEYQSTGDAAYRERMVGNTAGYAMNLVTNDLSAIRAYFAGAQAPADYQVPPKLEKLEVLGCMITHWHEHRVSLICLRTPTQATGDVWLFVMAQQGAHGVPAGNAPKYKAVADMGTASWSAQGENYLLVARGGNPAVKGLLGK